MKQLQQLLHHFKCMEKTVPKTSKKIWEIIEFQKLIKIEFLLPGGCKELVGIMPGSVFLLYKFMSLSSTPFVSVLY